MKLTHFRVRDYRSFADSGWVDAADFVTVIGASESGKTSLVTALWKLNPLTRAGAVKPELDIPRSRLDEITAAEEKPVFVEALFDMDDEAKAMVKEVLPLAATTGRLFASRDLSGTLRLALDERYEAEQVKVLTAALLKKLPKFMYYGNFGNLDSNVYLPSILRRFKRFGFNAASKTMARSLRIIFSYCGISSTRLLKDVRELKGDKDLKKLYAADIKQAIAADEAYYLPLLEEGVKRMSEEFSQYWKQGNVKFRLEFTDEELKFYISESGGLFIELQNHSSGLQWMVSFFLIYTVELENVFENVVLLFEDNGMTINPELQRDLVRLLEEMSKSSQIIVTTPNPYIVRAGDLDSVRVAYKGADGYSKVNNSLEVTPDGANKLSLNTVYTAMGMSVSEVSMTAFVPVLVPDTSDVFYLDVIKNYLAAGGWIYNSRDILFIPVGERGAEKTAKMLMTDGSLPHVILPATSAGSEMAQRLKSGLYGGYNSRRVISLSNIKRKAVSMEYLIPDRWIAEAAGVYIRSITSPAFDLKSRHLFKRIGEYAAAFNLNLPSDYREVIAQSVKVYAVKRYPKLKMSKCLFRKWRKLFGFVKRFSVEK